MDPVTSAEDRLAMRHMSTLLDAEECLRTGEGLLGQKKINLTRRLLERSKELMLEVNTALRGMKVTPRTEMLRLFHSRMMDAAKSLEAGIVVADKAKAATAKEG